MQTTAEFMRDLGLSPSPQRIAIYDFLKNNAIHPTVDTIYNAVKRLCDSGAIQEVIIEDGELRYDADMSDHGHFKCLKCGKVYDHFPPEGTPLISQIYGLPPDFEVSRLHLCCRGKCSACKSK